MNGITTVFSQAWTLFLHKQFLINWKNKSFLGILGTLAMDIGAPCILIYMYMANLVASGYLHSSSSNIDPMKMKQSMDRIMTNMLLPLSFFIFCRKLLGQIVQEKERGIKDYLKMNSMSETAYNLSFVMHETLVNGTIMIIMLDAIAWYRFKAENFHLYETFLFNCGIMLYIMGVTAFSILLSKLFSTAGFATQIGSILYLIPIFLSLYLKVLDMKHNFVQKQNEDIEKSIAKLGNHTSDQNVEYTRENMTDLAAMEDKEIPKSQGFEGLPVLEDELHIWEVIAQGSMKFFPHTPFTEVSLLAFQKAQMSQIWEQYALQVFDFVLIMFIVYFIENHLSMIAFVRSFFCKSPEIKYKSVSASLEMTESAGSEQANYEESENNGIHKRGQTKGSQSAKEFQETPAVQFLNMTKSFGSFTAVNNMNLNLFKNEIFCFLGHNGAGKTTSLNCLMGKETPSQGTVQVNISKEVIDITENTQAAQALMGVCSQHDVLFETLTVEQHMYLFHQLKSHLFGGGLTASQITQKVEQLIRTVSLDSHRHVETQNLSGGLRRRLSIALALISPSESSIVILDEPTTGLDAIVRDQVWQLIKSIKQNRCVVMTTQHLQEAEELADQVALLDMGKIVSKGSVDDIKKRFGIGYHLTVESAQQDIQKQEEEILRQIQGAARDDKNTSGAKTQYLLPFQGVDKFPQLFHYLEQEGLKFQLQQTSLEDAFLNFTNLNKVTGTGSKYDQESNEHITETDFQNFARLDSNESASSCTVFWYQFKATFLKRWYSFKRDWRMWLIMILPSALIAGFLLLGFQREFNPTLELKYTNSLLGNSTASTYKSDDLSGIISSLSSINGVDGYSSKAMSNMTSMGNKYISDITKDPSLENVFKNLVNFGADEDAANDPELKEIQDIIKSIMKEDLKIETPFDVITFGLKMMASQAAGSEQQTEMMEVKKKVQERVEAYYKKKMAPIQKQMAREMGQLMMMEGIRYMKEVIYLIWMVFSLAQCSGIAIENPVLERETKIRYYLNVLGMGQAAYWCGNFVFDLLCFGLQASLMVALIYPLKLHAYQKKVGLFIQLMCLFGPAHTLFSYLISFGFTKPQTALKFISIIYMIAGFVMPFLFKILSLGLDRCDGYVYSTTQIFTQAIPLQPMSTGLIDCVNKGHEGFFEHQEEQKQRSYERLVAQNAKKSGPRYDPRQEMVAAFQECDGFVKDGDTAMTALALSCISSIILIIFIERLKLYFYQSSECKYKKAEPSQDRDKILQTKHLSKTYNGNIHAVKNISFDLSKNGEVLGLLGSNGAGKSSTFNMVTMQLQRTAGDIYIFDKDIKDITNLEDVNITAQSDILWPYLSIEEHFKVISLIKGRPNYEKRFSKLTQLLELDHSHKYPAILSGGNKRKLCTALTLLTCPKLAYFDEPTVGLDPVSRRNLLNLIKQSDASVLFTTHRLDEAEYLCSRVAIIQKGKILYIGNTADINRSYQKSVSSQSHYYQGLVLVKQPKIDLSQKLAYFELDQEDVNQSLYKIKSEVDKEIPLSQIFRDLLTLKNSLEIEDFSYFEPSLHHAFVAISNRESQADGIINKNQ